MRREVYRLYSVEIFDPETGTKGPSLFRGKDKEGQRTGETDKRKIRRHARHNWGQSVRIRMYGRVTRNGEKF